MAIILRLDRVMADRKVKLVYIRAGETDESSLSVI